MFWSTVAPWNVRTVYLIIGSLLAICFSSTGIFGNGIVSFMHVWNNDRQHVDGTCMKMDINSKHKHHSHALYSSMPICFCGSSSTCCVAFLCVSSANCFAFCSCRPPFATVSISVHQCLVANPMSNRLSGRFQIPPTNWTCSRRESKPGCDWCYVASAYGSCSDCGVTSVNICKALAGPSSGDSDCHEHCLCTSDSDWGHPLSSCSTHHSYNAPSLNR